MKSQEMEATHMHRQLVDLIDKLIKKRERVRVSNYGWCGSLQEE